jgi:hypothetical protein
MLKIRLEKTWGQNKSRKVLYNVTGDCFLRKMEQEGNCNRNTE